MTEDTTKNDAQLDLLRELVQNQQAKDGLQAKITEQTTQISEQKELILNQKTELESLKSTVAQKDEVITNQASAIETLNGKVAELSQKIADINTANKNARRERIFNQYLKGTQKAFEARREEIFDDSKYEDLIFEMNQYQTNVKQPPTEESGSENVQNQTEQKPKFLNGVSFRFGADGKPIFEEA